MKVCHNCGTEWTMDFKPGFNEYCEACNADLHVCLNCRFYRPDAYDKCAEGVGEDIKYYDENNYCPQFEFKETDASEIKKKVDPEANKKAFDDLFKKD